MSELRPRGKGAVFFEGRRLGSGRGYGTVAGRLGVDGTAITRGTVQGHASAARRARTEGPLGRAGDRRIATGRADQGLLVPVCRDQGQCFRRPVLLDLPPTHRLPFWGQVDNPHHFTILNLSDGSTGRKTEER